MNRREFIEQLRGLLTPLPYGEQEDALQFYEEYFDDAGPENEQRVIEELESPEAVARKIIQNSPSAPAAQGWVNADGPHSGEGAPSDTAAGSAQYDSSMFERYYQNQQRMQQNSSNWALWLVLILTCPLWLPLGIGFIATLFSLVIAALALIFSFAVTVAALVAAVILTLILGVPMLFYDPLNGFYMISLAMIAAGASLILIPPVIWLCKKGIPAIFRGIGKLFSGSSKKMKSAFKKKGVR